MGLTYWLKGEKFHIPISGLLNVLIFSLCKISLLGVQIFHFKIILACIQALLMRAAEEPDWARSDPTLDFFFPRKGNLGAPRAGETSWGLLEDKNSESISELFQQDIEVSL